MINDNDVILSVLNAFPDRKVKGRLKFQKTMFFLKTLGLPVHDSFRFRYYGPYSESLKARLDTLASQSKIKESAKLLKNGETRYEITANEAASGQLDAIAGWDEYLVRQVVSLVQDMRSEALELAASYYWFAAQSETDVEEVWERVSCIKPASWGTCEQEGKKLVAQLSTLTS